jgi:hypothetical protein
MAKVVFDRVVFEVRYAFGSTYLDRAGQTLVDLERSRPGWVPGEVTPQGGNNLNPERGYTVLVNASLVNFTTSRLENPEELSDLKSIASEVDETWRVVKANLGVKEFPRLAARFFFLAPTNSEEDSERVVERSTLQLQLPNTFSEKYSLDRRQIVAVVKSTDTEYRVELHGIVQATGLAAPEVLVTSPRLLSKGQRAAQVAMARARERASKDYRHAASLDVDCVQYDVESFSAKSYLLDQFKVVEADFKPLLAP